MKPKTALLTVALVIVTVGVVSRTAMGRKYVMNQPA